MKTRAATLVLLPLLALGASSDAPKAKDSTAVSQSTLPIFSPEGFRTALLTGSMNFSTSGQRVDLTDMRFTSFSGDASNRIEATVIAPEATYLRADQVAQGDKSVRYLTDMVDASATKWTYSDKEKSISLDGNVHLTFQIELKEIFR